MLILLALPVIVAVATIHRYLQIYAPSNLLVRRVRAQLPRWRTASALVAVVGVLLALMHAVVDAVAAGAPDSLNLAVLILAWDAIKISMLTVFVCARCARCAARAICAFTATLRPATHSVSRVRA